MWFATAVLLPLVLSGPQIYLLASSATYQEVIFWAAALTAVFNLIVMRRLLAGEFVSAAELYALAALVLLCGVPVGFGLGVALGIVMLSGLWRRQRQPDRRIAFRHVLAAGAVGLLGVGVQPVVNLQRWGDILAIAPWRYYQQMIDPPC